MLKLRDLTLMSPCVTVSQVELYGEKYPLAALDQSELDIFKAQIADILMIPGSDERKIMEDRLEQYVYGLRSAKSELNDVKFTGMNPEDTELGFGLIRPQFCCAASQTGYLTNWRIALTASWADWLYVSSGVGYVIGKDFSLVITHLKSLASPTPFMAECRFQVGRRGILIPVPTRGLRMADSENNVPIVSLPTMILKPKSSLYAAARADTGLTGTDEIELGGLVFGLGRVLKETSTVTWTI